MILDVTIQAPDSSSYNQAQFFGLEQLRLLGFKHVKWIYGQGVTNHTYRIFATTTAEKTLLVLKAQNVDDSYQQRLVTEKETIDAKIKELQVKSNELKCKLSGQDFFGDKSK